MMKTSESMRQLRRSSGFTLIEMLVVIGIIVLLMALAVPSFVGTMQANKLSAAGQNLVGRLSQAQQTASSTNMPVEVRFYRYTDPSALSAENNFAAYQFLLVKLNFTGNNAAEVMEPLSAPFYIESGVFISTGNISSSPASPLLSGGTGNSVQVFQDDGSNNSGVSKQIRKSANGTANYVAIRFYPDGTVKRLGASQAGTDNNLGSNTSVRQLQTLALRDAYLTLVGEKDLTSNVPIANYYAVQLDPYTGHVRSFQPGL